MGRADDITLPAETDWLTDSRVRQVHSALTDAGYEAYFVGGCVRNALLQAGPSDIDIATNARPDQIIEAASAAGLKAVPTGIDHGTVTLVAQGEGIEVTTYRRDVETDGRHAVVAFSDDVAEDAARRDFSMNALYADMTGRVIDPLGGLPDLFARRVRFIGNAGERITEDYLRILRFFRFSAWYGDLSEGFERDALAEIAEHLHGLETLSIERITQELIKLLSAPDPVLAVGAMAQNGVLARVMPGGDLTYLGPTVHLEQTLNRTPNWQLRLAALGGAEALRLSKADANTVQTLRDAAGSGQSAGEIAYRSGAEIAERVLILRAAIAGQPLAAEAFACVEEGASAKFPVKATDLMPAYQGPALGARLAALEEAWIASGFTATRDSLLEME